MMCLGREHASALGFGCAGAHMHKGHMRGDHDMDTKRGRSARGRRTDRREMERDRDRNGPGDASDEGANAFASRYQSIEEVCGQVGIFLLCLLCLSGQEHTDKGTMLP